MITKRWKDQTSFYSESTRGNCMQAAVASLLNLAIDEVPNFIESKDKHCNDLFYEWLEARGFEVYRRDATESSEPCHEGFYLACGPSARGVSHMVVMRDGRLAHDPHPDRSGIEKVETTFALIALDPSVSFIAD